MPRESEPKRHRSRFDRESSPKRSRRNGKPTMERSPNGPSPELRDKDDDRKHKDDDRKHRHRLQDPLPLEKPHASNYKHDDRSNAGQDGTGTGRGGRSDRGGWRSQEDDRRGKHGTSSDAVKKDEKTIARRDDSRLQSQDEPSKTNADQLTKKKFREEKLLPAEKAIAASETDKARHPEGAAAAGVGAGGRREERGLHRYPGRNERDRAHYAGNRFLPNRARPEMARGGFSSGRDRFRGREGNTRRQGYGAGGVGGGHVDKWKHDMFDQVNQSPTSKNEEDPVAKVEALLAL